MARRVLCLTSSFPRWPGDDTTPFVLNLAVDLRAEGWAVDVLAPHAPGAASAESLEGVAVERFRYLLPEAQQTLCYRGGALVNLRRTPSNWLKLPALVLAEIAALALRLRSRRYDLVHSHWVLPQGFAASLVAPALGVPHVATVHGSDVFVLSGRWVAPFQRFALRRADAVTVNSTATASAVSRLLPDASRTHLLPMGATLPDAPPPAVRVDAVRARHRRGAGPLLVFVGRLVREKGVAEIVEAVGLLREALPDVTALLVGDGPDRGDFERLVAARGLGDRVAFAGWVEPSEVHGLLAAADVYVGPSHVEAQGLAFLESMWAGTPVVASRVGGIVDTVLHERTGLLVAPESPRELADAVLRLHADPGLASRLARQARDHVREGHSRQAAAARFAGLFEAVLAARRGGPQGGAPGRDTQPETFS